MRMVEVKKNLICKGEEIRMANVCWNCDSTYLLLEQRMTDESSMNLEDQYVLAHAQQTTIEKKIILERLRFSVCEPIFHLIQHLI